MKQIIECVPNFSEGRDRAVIDAITAEIEKGGEVSLLDVDPGEATNRTVVTFVGEPEAVCEAAFRGIKKASELIDMRNHHGAHPRMGATDVCPLIPVSGITLEECAELARGLARRVSDELGIPTYCYEAAAFTPERRNLAVCRAGEYEALPEKMNHEGKGPDFGDRPYDEDAARTGATTIGARDFLIAVNYNLNTTSTRRANAIAFDVREKGRPMREGGKVTGKPVKDADGNVVMIPGTLKGTKAIGWFIDEYGIAQVSMNITNMRETPLHKAFDEVCAKAAARGVRVTGAEIVGLVPKSALIEAGKHYLRMQQRSLGIPEDEIIRIAVKSMGLDDLKPFKPEEKIIEYMLEAGKEKSRKLTDMTLTAFADETSSESPAPGGGFPLIWALLVPHSAPWWPICPHTRPDGTTAGRSFPTPPRRDVIYRTVSSLWWTRIPKHSTVSWMCSQCPKVLPKRRRPVPRRCRKPLFMPQRCRCVQ